MRQPSPQLTAFARTLKKLRRERDLSQEALADRSGVSAKHIGEIERANKEPGITTVLRLIDGLGLAASDVFALVDDQLLVA
jgi:transcriptional regulator with XRE-family HTH domain